MAENIFVKEPGEGYYEEKKSKFLAVIFPITSEEEATCILEQIRKKYWDARHNCYAFVIGDNNEISRCSDDGEPSGTAGKPILEVLLGAKIHNALLVVTRYFGGTLLGTGGLVRAYQKSASDAILNCKLALMTSGSELTVETDYNGLGKLQFMARNNGIELEIEYTDVVTIKMALPQEQVDKIKKEIIELTLGKAKISEEKGKQIIKDYCH